MMAASVTKVAPRFAKDTTPTTTSSAASSPCAMRQPVDEDTAPIVISLTAATRQYTPNSTATAATVV